MPKLPNVTITNELYITSFITNSIPHHPVIKSAIANNTINNTGFTQASGTLCSSDFSVAFSPEGKFSIVLIHEATESSLKENSDTAKTLGLVEFAFRDIQIQSQVNIMPVVFFSIGLIGIIWVAYEKFNAVKNRKAS